MSKVLGWRTVLMVLATVASSSILLAMAILYCDTATVSALTAPMLAKDGCVAAALGAREFRKGIQAKNGNGHGSD